MATNESSFQRTNSRSSQALSEEKQTYERSSNKSVYLNVAVNTLKRLRREAAAQAEAASVGETSTSAPDSRPQGANKVVSHALVLQGALGARTSFSIEKNRYKKPAVELTGESVFEPWGGRFTLFYFGRLCFQGLGFFTFSF